MSQLHTSHTSTCCLTLLLRQKVQTQKNLEKFIYLHSFWSGLSITSGRFHYVEVQDLWTSTQIFFNVLSIITIIIVNAFISFSAHGKPHCGSSIKCVFIRVVTSSRQPAKLIIYFMISASYYVHLVYLSVSLEKDGKFSHLLQQ